MANPFQERFKSIEDKLQRTLAELPARAGAIVVLHANDAFRNQGFTDQALEPWTPRKAETTKSTGRAILVLTGRLRRSIRVISATPDSVTIGTDVPYARIHNEGGAINHPSRGGILNFSHTPANSLWKFGKANTIRQQRGIKAIRRVTYKAFTTTMPQRKFLGNSRTQTEDIEFMITNHLKKAFSI